jgi:hypothetical protein
LLEPYVVPKSWLSVQSGSRLRLVLRWLSLSDERRCLFYCIEIVSQPLPNGISVLSQVLLVREIRRDLADESKRVHMKEEKPLIHVHLTKQATTTLCDKPFNGSTWQCDERSFESSARIVAYKDLISCPECLKRVGLKTDTLPSEMGISPVETTPRDDPTSISLASLGSQLKVR